MSKIFEALRKTEGEVAEVAKAVLGEGISGVPAFDSNGAIASVRGQTTNSAADLSDKVRSVTVDLVPESPLLPFHGIESRAAQQYRIIRTKIDHHPGQPRVVMVSSPMPGDGKTVSAINLAAVFALHEQIRVLLIDCDFRRTSATGLLGVPRTPGLLEVLRNETSLESALVRIDKSPNLYVLAPGGTSTGATELLASAQWQELMDLCRSEFSFVILDAPPIGAVAEYDLLQLSSDGVVLVVRQDHTNRQLLRKALDSIPKAKQLGVILNCSKEWFLWKTHSYYYYSGKAG